MALSSSSKVARTDSIEIKPFSELKNYEKIGVLGSGGFGKVYLWRLGEEAQSLDGVGRDEKFVAAKLQGFTGGPALNRREAMILKRLLNPEVYSKHGRHT